MAGKAVGTQVQRKDTMGIFSRIKDAIFGSAAAQEAPPAATTPTPPAQGSAAAPVAALLPAEALAPPKMASTILPKILMEGLIGECD